MSEFKNYYRILQVDSSAEPEVITAAYKRLALKYHPDTNKSPDATRRMQEINEAYSVLSDPIARERYDQERNRRHQDKEAEARQTHEEERGQDETEAARWRGQERQRQERAEAEQHAREERRKQAEAEATRRREQERAEAERRRAEYERIKRARQIVNANSQLRWGCIIIYIIVAIVLFLMLAGEVNSIWVVAGVLIAAGVISIPVAFRLDDYLRRR